MSFWSSSPRQRWTPLLELHQYSINEGATTVPVSCPTEIDGRVALSWKGDDWEDGDGNLMFLGHEHELVKVRQTKTIKVRRRFVEEQIPLWLYRVTSCEFPEITTEKIIDLEEAEALIHAYLSKRL